MTGLDGKEMKRLRNIPEGSFSYDFVRIDRGFSNHYYDRQTGKEISTREALVRKSKVHRIKAKLEETKGNFGEMERDQKLAKRYEEESKTACNNPNRACYISTACTEVAGLPDDCLELQTLRQFRDNYVANQHKGNELIQEYYDLAPHIVRAIQGSPNAHDIFSRIFERDILTAVDMVSRGDNEGALQHYVAMTDRLKRECVD